MDRDAPLSALDITTDNTIVAARGSHIEFKRNDQAIRGYETRFKDRTAFTPTKVMMHDRNQRILMLTPQKSNVLVRYDTETGKNIGEVSLRFHEELDERIDAIVPIKKFSQLQASDRVQLVGASINTLFNFDWDPRTPDPAVVVTPEKRFTKPTKHNFTSVATTSTGEIVAGSTDGVVRLFSSPDPEKHIMKRSKTNLNQLADPVKGVEVSSTGEWVVWTTKEYIAVVNTTFTDKNNNVNNGFIKSMGDSRPDALILRLSPEDMARHGIEEVNFTSARFDNGPYVDPSGANIIEEEIVASTGQFLVRWKFRLVKLDYARSRESSERAAKPMIYRQQETIVDKTFEYGSNHVVAALQSDFSVLSFDDDE